jgi:hypothetical protein
MYLPLLCHTVEIMQSHSLLHRNTLLLILIALIGFFVWLTITIKYSDPSMDTDFSQDYKAGLGVLQPTSIYGPFDPSRFNRAENQHMIWGFHPPTVAPFFVPFALLSFPVAFTLFSIISLLLFIGLLLYCSRNLNAGGLPGWVFGMFLLWYPFTFCIARGQFAVLLAVLLVGVAQALDTRKDVRAGCLLGAAIAVKIFPAICCLYLLLTRRWVALFVTGLTAVAILILTILLVGLSDVRLYFDQIAVINLDLYATHYINISLNNLIAPLFVPNVWVETISSWPIVAKAFSFVASGGIVAALVWLTFRFEPTGSPFNWGLFYMYATASTILSPISWEHNFLIAIPGFVLFFSRFTKVERRVFALIVLFLGVPLVNLLGPVIQFYAPAKVGLPGFLLTRLHTVGLLLILFLFSRNLTASD